MIQAGVPHESVYTYVPEPTEQKDVPLIHAPAPHHYNAMVRHSINGATRTAPAVNPQSPSATISPSKPVPHPPNATLLAILHPPPFSSCFPMFYFVLPTS